MILPPALLLTLRDTQPAQNPDLWLAAIVQLQQKLQVKSDTELDGLRIKALNQIPPFLLSLLRPLRSASTGLSTNLAVLQTSLLLKYQPFYAFLLQSPKIAKQIERGYVNAARAYYETGMRRYTRALTSIKARNIDKAEMGMTESPRERLQYAEVDAGVVLAYMADDKEFVSSTLLQYADFSYLLQKLSSDLYL
jgi:hypothetical protein